MSSLVCSLLPFSVANATSVYDNTITTVDGVHVARMPGSLLPACGVHDLSSSWSSVFLDSTKWGDDWTQRIGGVTFEEMRDAFNASSSISVSQGNFNAGYTNIHGTEFGQSVFIQFTVSPTAYIDFGSAGGHTFAYTRNTDGDYVYNVRLSLKNTSDCSVVVNQVARYTGTQDIAWLHSHIGSPNFTIASDWESTDTGFNTDARPWFINTPISYPTGYAGEVVSTDLDGDGLVASREVVQGTSNTNKDTDGDGLSDYVESQWYYSRNNVFCGSQCAYPDPVAKDLYVEIDWMKDSNNRSFKPSATQLDLVKDAYEDKGIIFHADTGQFGGGNQLPTFSGSLIFAPTENKLDFYDQKNGTSTVTANFSADRRNIWHYMITGHNYEVSDGEAGTTGASFPGDDDSIISIEAVESINPTNLDTAIAGTILHELGHNLCLTSQSSENYPSQPAECIYGEIDKPLGQNPSLGYESVMSYRFQLSRTDYSHGVNGAPNDHDDWSAVALGIDDFVNSIYEWDDTQNIGGRNSQRSYDSRVDDIQR
ncbi:MAG TPA: hypothetical protein VK502_00600 [Candidatus Saccharimonadales bacterium]|nr:hypothetical protein [Candidatus Saccharimonadales bacterium]